MPIFDFKCHRCLRTIEEYVRKPDDIVHCPECGNDMTKLASTFKFTYEAGDFFEPYVDTDIHPDGKPIQINSKEAFFAACRKHGRGYRKVKDKLR